MSEQRSRKWQLTINNPNEHNLDHEEIKCLILPLEPKYWCLCDETGGKTGTYHTHLYLQFETGRRFGTFKTVFPTAHIEVAHGTAQENRDYIAKTGEKWQDSAKEETNHPETFEESGTCLIEKQGQRSDIAFLYENIKLGTSVTRILEETPSNLRYIGLIDRARAALKADEQEAYLKKVRDVRVTYLYGAAGVGKTTYVYEKCGFENVYKVTDYLHPWDTYNGEDVLFLDEYRGQFEISFFLNLLDKWPLILPARFHNRIACWSKIYVVSNLAFEDLYYSELGLEYETRKALRRRFHCIATLAQLQQADKLG